MNRMLITVTNKYMTIKCNTEEEVKKYIANSFDSEVVIYEPKMDITYIFRTMHHPNIYKVSKKEVKVYIDGITDEGAVPLAKTAGQFSRDEIESLIPSLTNALHTLIDKVNNVQNYIIEF